MFHILKILTKFGVVTQRFRQNQNPDENQDQNQDFTLVFNTRTAFPK